MCSNLALTDMSCRIVNSVCISWLCVLCVLFSLELEDAAVAALALESLSFPCRSLYIL